MVKNKQGERTTSDVLMFQELELTMAKFLKEALALRQALAIVKILTEENEALKRGNAPKQSARGFELNEAKARLAM
ncbi:hypothetical protein N7468_001334 [Penicillium chermesinum]|uniref:Uncharacterized protein n=1 Tax=Penicillium chermesinum TaxID=63820 RepID=A0A9W9TWG5_9EURO|nr:uncharacterized protein N7468_001334 [Penicillium chermesinum]KAJ5246351.1 hypothetical protein N7468_001334 [Penicillium chermesinum]